MSQPESPSTEDIAPDALAVKSTSGEEVPTQILLPSPKPGEHVAMNIGADAAVDSRLNTLEKNAAAVNIVLSAIRASVLTLPPAIPFTRGRPRRPQSPREKEVLSSRSRSTSESRSTSRPSRRSKSASKCRSNSHSTSPAPSTRSSGSRSRSRSQNVSKSRSTNTLGSRSQSRSKSPKSSRSPKISPSPICMGRPKHQRGLVSPRSSVSSRSPKRGPRRRSNSPRETNCPGKSRSTSHRGARSPLSSFSDNGAASVTSTNYCAGRNGNGRRDPELSVFIPNEKSRIASPNLSRGHPFTAQYTRTDSHNSYKHENNVESVGRGRYTRVQENYTRRGQPREFRLNNTHAADDTQRCHPNVRKAPHSFRQEDLFERRPSHLPQVPRWRQ